MKQAKTPACLPACLLAWRQVQIGWILSIMNRGTLFGTMLLIQDANTSPCSQGTVEGMAWHGDFWQREGRMARRYKYKKTKHQLAGHTDSRKVLGRWLKLTGRSVFGGSVLTAWLVSESVVLTWECFWVCLAEFRYLKSHSKLKCL